MKHTLIYLVAWALGFCTACKGQSTAALPQENIKYEVGNMSGLSGPHDITRNIIQDKKGNIWVASWEGVFKYDGKSFSNITNKVSSARFFSLLQDRNGNFWFGSIGAGVYYYDGRSFKHFTIKDGLLNNDVGCIYEDKKGNIWFGVFGGASRYDGKSFQNYIIAEDTMTEDHTGRTFPERPPYEVTSIIEDSAGKFWFATRGNTFVYDGKAFAVFAHGDTSFRNVRSLVQDRHGCMWIGGADGLWRYDGRSFTNVMQQFVGYIIEDRKGNIWTSAGRDNRLAWLMPSYGGKPLAGEAWALSRYDGKSLSDQRPAGAEIASKEGMLFGLLEANDGSIWFGTGNGVFRYAIAP